MDYLYSNMVINGTIIHQCVTINCKVSNYYFVSNKYRKLKQLQMEQHSQYEDYFMTILNVTAMYNITLENINYYEYITKFLQPNTAIFRIILVSKDKLSI